MSEKIEKIKHELIQKAKAQYMAIFPCIGKKSLEECFTYYGNKLFFWFNTADHSTHIVMTEAATSSAFAKSKRPPGIFIT